MWYISSVSARNLNIDFYRQVALADVLIVNKLDLVGTHELRELKNMLRYTGY